MKTLSVLICILNLVTCNSTENDQIIKRLSIENKNSFITNSDTVQINEDLYTRLYVNGRFNCLLSISGDTIVKPENYYHDIQILDINKDGQMDLRVFISSNTQNQCKNYLFDQKLNTFRLIENCDLDIQMIEGTEFYYSYNSLGCSDLDWESHLSKIENFKLVEYGYINGQGCDYKIENNPRTIDIYKMETDMNKKSLINSLPYLEHIPKFSSKWSFIKKYWEENCSSFNE